jgi:small-conductance mechanosensitive channel
MTLSEKSLSLAHETSAWLANHSVDILIATGAGIVVALVLIGVRAFGHRLINDKSPDQKWQTIMGSVLSKTSLIFIVACSAELVAEHAATPQALLRIINILFVITASFQAAIWARELILGFIQYRAGDEDDHGRLGSAIGIIRLLVTVALFIIATILILDNLGVNVTGLIAGLGIGGIAIGLAAQGIFSDLFAALSIIFDKPFRKGDNIRFDTTIGTVEQIGLKTTRIRSVEGQEIVISNTNLLNKEINNFANAAHRRIALTLSVIYQTPPATLRHIPAMVRAIVEAHDKSKVVRCGLAGFGASSLDFELQFDVHSDDYEDVFATRSAVCMEIVEAFNQAGILFAYPTQTTFTAAPDGSMIMPYATPATPALSAVAAGSNPDIVKR